MKAVWTGAIQARPIRGSHGLVAAKKSPARARAPVSRLPVLPPERPASARRARRAPAELPDTVSWWAAFYRVVRRIPAGRVCTYGAVAAMAGHPRAARHVGHALSALKETDHRGVPWHRVLGSRPRRRAAISIKDPVGAAIQRKLLEAEGVAFDDKGNISLDHFGWFRSTPVPAPAKKKAKKPAAERPRKAAQR